MSFRREGKAQFNERRDWDEWLTGLAELAATAGLPPSIVGSESAWRYFVDRTYSQAGYLGLEPWYTLDQLTSTQLDAVRQLLIKWLSDRWPDAPPHSIQSLQTTFGLRFTNT
jgi:hypothetical protein